MAAGRCHCQSVESSGDRPAVQLDITVEQPIAFLVVPLVLHTSHLPTYPRTGPSRHSSTEPASGHQNLARSNRHTIPVWSRRATLHEQEHRRRVAAARQLPVLASPSCPLSSVSAVSIPPHAFPLQASPYPSRPPQVLQQFPYSKSPRIGFFPRSRPAL